jgi:hypothetical protein
MAGATGVAASRFGPLGVRIMLATSSADGCEMETMGVLSSSSNTNEAAGVLLTLAPGLCPGTYNASSEALAPIQAQYQYNEASGGGGALILSGSVTLTQIDSAQGVQGSYHFDFGPSGNGGGSSSLPDGGVINYGPIGELIEDGTFFAPPCDLCPSPPSCGDAGCPSGEICERGCGGPDGVCQPGPTCTGAPSCASCALDAGAICGTWIGGDCFVFDGFSLICGCFP